MLRSKKEQRNYDIVFETFVLLYKASEPFGDFNELYHNCKYEDQYGNPIDVDGYLTDDEVHERMLKRVIPFNDYLIDREVAYKIVEDQEKKYKLNKLERTGLQHNIWYGPSPKFKPIIPDEV